MTKKQDVNLETHTELGKKPYEKHPRLLAKPMEDALDPGGELNPILVAAQKDGRLRLEIRDRQFNVYYRGGSLLRVNGRSAPWTMHFDDKYFAGGGPPPVMPERRCETPDDAHRWTERFSALMNAMDDWWTRHPQAERNHCQAMAAVNSASTGLPTSDYLILDLEYQYAQCRFDMMAAKRHPTERDSTGWVEPDLVFVEVKSKPGACSGAAGLRAHAEDYSRLVTARNGEHSTVIKREFEGVIAQKKRLGLISDGLPFKQFSAAVPELLLVLVGLSPKDPKIEASLAQVIKVSDALGGNGRICYMLLDPYAMIASDARSLAPPEAS